MADTTQAKSQKFVALHERAGAFVIPNPWDAGSARLLGSLGFEALATSSGAAAGVYGRRDCWAASASRRWRRRAVPPPVSMAGATAASRAPRPLRTPRRS